MSEKYIEHNGKVLLTAEALLPQPDGTTKEAVFGIMAEDLKAISARGQGTVIAQLYRLVIPGLILSRHIFKGLRRPLYCDGLMDGDKDKLIYSRKPAVDYELIRGISAGSYQIARRDRPADRTFITIVSPNNKHQDAYPMVHAWIEHWNWVEEDQGLPEAPVGWLERYDNKLFTRNY